MNDERSVRSAGLVAGVALLVLSALAGFGNFVVVQGLVTADDPARTVAAILASEGLFRLGVVSFYVVVVLDIVVAWALYRFFEAGQRGVALAAAWFRASYAAVFLMAAGQLAVAVDLLAGGDAAGNAGMAEPSRQMLAWAGIEAFGVIWSAALTLFGVHLALLGYLMLRRPGRPARIIGVLLVVAGVGYVFDSAAKLLWTDVPFDVSMVTFVGELALMVWLLVTFFRRQESKR